MVWVVKLLFLFCNSEFASSRLIQVTNFIQDILGVVKDPNADGWVVWKQLVSVEQQGLVESGHVLAANPLAMVERG